MSNSNTNNTNKANNNKQNTGEQVTSEHLKSELNSLAEGIKTVLAEEPANMKPEVEMEQALAAAGAVKEEEQKVKFDYFTVAATGAIALVSVGAARLVARGYASQMDKEAESMVSIAGHAFGSALLASGIAAVAKATVYKADKASEIGNLVLGNTIGQAVSVADAWFGNNLVNAVSGKASDFFSEETSVVETAEATA